MIMLEGLCPHGAKSFGAISLSPVVPAVCFGVARTPAETSNGFCYDNNSSVFAKQFANLRLEFETLYIVYTSYRKQLLSYHHHKGHEICFVLLSNIGEHEICL